MIVRKISMQNIRSHVNSEISFGEGFNCLVGGVGVGKTSILLALHFTLFGEPLYRGYDYLLRDEANVGRFLLEFEHGGRNYELRRTLRRDRGRINQDADALYLYEGGKAVAYGKIMEVRDYVRKITGIDRKMFEEFIWIQQERLKEILSMPPRERQAILDHLFGLSDFKKAEDKLASIMKDYQREQNHIEQDPSVLTLKERHEQYDNELTEKSNLQKELEASNTQLSAAENAFKMAEEELKRLEAKERKFNELKQVRTAAEASVSDFRRHADSLNLQIERRKQSIIENRNALEELKEEERTMRHRLSEAQIDSSSNLDQLKESIKNFQEQSNKLGEEISKNNADIDRAEVSLMTLKGEKVCPTCRRKIQQRSRERLMDKLQEEQLEGSRRLANLADRKREVDVKLRLAQEVERKMAIIAVKTEDFERRIAEGERYVAETMAEATEYADRIAKNETRVKDIDLELNELPLLDLDAMRRRRDEAYAKYRDLQGSITNLEKLIEEKNKTLTLLQETIKSAEEKQTQKRRIELAATYASDIKLAYREIVPLLRKLYIASLKQAVQSVVNSLMAESARILEVDVDEEYTPTVIEEGFRRDVNFVSGGERTWLALAYRIGLGQLIMEARTGQSLEMLILDEPTESLGSEDRSIEALATAISNLKMIRQIITVTHSDELSRKASTRILLTREGNVSNVEETS